MIVFPMAGQSSRFFNAGYSRPKYELPIGNQTLFARVVASFGAYYDSKPFLFIVPNRFGAASFVAAEISKLGIKNFEIVTLVTDTRGQAESVIEGLKNHAWSDPFVIFNIDTIRPNFRWPENFGDGFIEVFECKEGDNWSFIEPRDDLHVASTTEKVRISNLCSTGIYGFSSPQIYRQAYENSWRESGERFVAPLFNHLIKNGLAVTFKTINKEDIFHCGVPEDYEQTHSLFSMSSKPATEI